MNIKHAKILYTILIIIGLSSCTISPSDDRLCAYLFNVIDSYPSKRTSKDADSAKYFRNVQFRYHLKNNTKQVFWLKLTKYDGREPRDTISFINFSVNYKGKSICVDPHDQKKSFIFPKEGKHIDYTNNKFYPGDSAYVIINVPEYILDSLGISKFRSAIDLTKMISFISHHKIDNYKECQVPTIKLVNSNRIGKVDDFTIAKRVANQYEIYNDSINKVTYAFPFHWKVPVVNSVNVKQ